MFQSKRQYEKSFKDSEKSIEAYKKADADIHLSRAEVDKAKNLMHSKQSASEESKKEYALELQKTNDFQQTHYDTTLPGKFQVRRPRMFYMYLFDKQMAGIW